MEGHELNWKAIVLQSSDLTTLYPSQTRNERKGGLRIIPGLGLNHFELMVLRPLTETSEKTWQNRKLCGGTLTELPCKLNLSDLII